MVGSSSKRGAAVVDLTGEDNFAPTNMSESSRKREHAFIDLTGADQYVGANRNKMPRIAHIAAGSSQYLPLQISSDVESEDGDQWEESVEWPDGSQEYDEVALQMLEHYGTLTTKIVGVRYYSGFATMGEMVLLRREPSNPYDRNAIRVLNVRQAQVGHISRAMAEKLAPYMDSKALVIEAYIAGTIGHFECPLTLKLFGSSDPVEKANLVNQMKLDKLPLDGIRQREKEARERINVEKERIKALKKVGRGAVVGNGGYRELSVGDFAAGSSHGFGPDLDILIEASERFNPRNVEEMIQKFGNKEEDLKKMPKADQPESLSAKLLPFQLQGLHWLLSKESPQLPPVGSKNSVQLWTRSSSDSSVFTHIATNYSLKNELPQLASGGILADDMGLGKTIQTISLIVADAALRKAKKQSCGATLILCPLSVMSNWSSQIQRHVKEEYALRVLIYHGARRQPINPKEVKKYDVVITTYETVSNEYWSKRQPKVPTKDGLYSVEWRRLVLDEGHNIRNPGAKRTVAAMNLLAQSRWVLTGTPIINSLKDLYSITKFLRLSGGIDRFELFHGAISRPVMQGNETGTYRLQSLMKDICLRRKKDMSFVDLRLPDISEYVHRITLSPNEQKKYDALEAEAKGVLDTYRMESGTREGAKAYRHLLEILLRMRQVCNHWKLCGEERFADILSVIDQQGAVELTPENREKLQQLLQLSIDSQEDCPVCIDSLRDPVITCCAHVFCYACIERVIDTQQKCPMCRAELPAVTHLVRPAREMPEEDIDMDTSSSKVAAIMKILRASMKKDPTTKTVIFSQWTSFLNILGNNLEDLGITFTRIDGTMPALARDAAMSELESSPECTVLLASLGVCSVGLNLVAANQVIMSDSWWAPAIEDQAVDRVYRLGQRREVKVWRVVVEGSVEERVLQVQEDKRKLVSVAMGEKQGNKKNKSGRIGDIIRLLT